MAPRAHDEETFEKADAEASHTYPMQAGLIRKGGYIMIRHRPCKVTDCTSHQTGKHGHTKCTFIAQDLFTGKKMEDQKLSGHNTDVPVVKKSEYQLMYLGEGGYVSCLDLVTLTPRGDLKLPDCLDGPVPSGAADISARIRKGLQNDQECNIVTLSACGEEQIVDVKFVDVKI